MAKRKVLLVNTGLPCSVCGRRAGYAPLNRFGSPDVGPDVPLGEMATCPVCGRLACPDCLQEGDCCDGIQAEAAATGKGEEVDG